MQTQQIDKRVALMTKIREERFLLSDWIKQTDRKPVTRDDLIYAIQKFGAYRHNKTLSGLLQLDGLNLAGVNLVGLDISALDFTKADLSSTVVDKAGFCHIINIAQTAGVEITGLFIEDCDISGLELSQDVKINEIIFSGVKLDFIALKSIVPHIRNGRCKLIHADLSGIEIRGGVVQDDDTGVIGYHFIDLKNLDLSYCDLSNAKISGVDLSGSNMSYAKLVNVELTQSYAKNTDFSNADIENCDFSHSDFTGANFSNTHFKNVTI